MVNKKRAALGLVAAPLLAAFGTPGSQDSVVSVTATVETTPVRHSGDAADDPAIWVHPTDPARSLVLGDDKAGGLCVYGLDGVELSPRKPRRSRADPTFSEARTTRSSSAGGRTRRPTAESATRRR